METSKRCENYSIGTVMLSNFVSLGIYGLGFLIMFKLNLVLSLLYILYILALEYRLIRYHCTNCFYYGKMCGFGKGIVSSWFFKKGDNSKFCAKSITWRDMIPDILVSLIPFVTGIILMLIKFDCIILIALLLLLAFTTIVNGYIRGTLTCRHCKQKELGCPADMLFTKGK